MITLDEYFDLLLNTLPPIQRCVQNEFRQLSERSTTWELFHHLQIHLKTTELYCSLQQISPSHNRRRTKSSERDMRTAATDILDALEVICKFPELTAIQGPSSYVYPKLEKIRDGYIKFTVEDRPRELQELLERVGLAEDILCQNSRHITRYPRKRLPEIETSTRDNPIMINQLLRDLKAGLDSDNVWECKCFRSHTYLMFLARNCLAKEQDSHLILDMLLRSGLEGSPKWTESRTFAKLPPQTNDNCDNDFSHSMKQINLKSRFSLCAEVSKAPTSKCIGLHFQDSQLFLSRPFPARLNHIKATPSQTLKSILNNSGIIRPENRIVLAILISYCVLHMTSSDWLPPGWDSGDIHFLKSDDGNLYMLRPLIASKMFPTDIRNRRPWGEIHRHPDLLQLGIVLLEIFLKQPLEKLQKAEDIGDWTFVTTDANFFTAVRVLEETGEAWDVYEHYREAVSACLELDIPEPDSLAENSEYLRYIVERIIRPLEKELVIMNSVLADELDDFIVKTTSPSESGATHESTHGYMFDETFQSDTLSHKRSKSDNEILSEASMSVSARGAHARVDSFDEPSELSRLIENNDDRTVSNYGGLLRGEGTKLNRHIKTSLSRIIN